LLDPPLATIEINMVELCTVDAEPRGVGCVRAKPTVETDGTYWRTQVRVTEKRLPLAHDDGGAEAVVAREGTVLAATPKFV
jgi:hypothetical protein